MKHRTKITNIPITGLSIAEDQLATVVGGITASGNARKHDTDTLNSEGKGDTIHGDG